MGAKKHGPSKDGMRAKYLDQVVPEQNAAKDRRDALQKVYEANHSRVAFFFFHFHDLHVLPCAPHVGPKEYKSGSSHVSFPSICVNPPVVRHFMFALPDRLYQTSFEHYRE